MALPPLIYLPGGKGYIDGTGKFVAISLADAMACCCTGGGTTCTVFGCTFSSTDMPIYFYRDDFINNFTSAINTRTEIPSLALAPTANCGEFEGTGVINTYTGPVPLTLVQTDVIKVRVRLEAVITWKVYWQNITLGTPEVLHATITGDCSGFNYNSIGAGAPTPTRHDITETLTF